MRCYVVVWQRVIGMVCVLLVVLSAVLCGGVAACHRYGVCTVRFVELISCLYMFQGHVLETCRGMK